MLRVDVTRVTRDATTATESPTIWHEEHKNKQYRVEGPKSVNGTGWAAFAVYKCRLNHVTRSSVHAKGE